MHQYEIRVLNEKHAPSLVMLSNHLNANAAVKAARKAANGMAFEVWREDECVYVTADNQPLPFPARRSA